MRVVAHDEVDARLHQAAGEMNFARQAVELGDDQRRVLSLGKPPVRPRFLRPVIALAALDFGKLGDDHAGGGCYMPSDRLALRPGRPRPVAPCWAVETR